MDREYIYSWEYIGGSTVLCSFFGSLRVGGTDGTIMAPLLEAFSLTTRLVTQASILRVFEEMTV